MESPPIPDYHFPGKLYCPECTRDHSLYDCPKQKKGHSSQWELEGNPAFLKGKARRMARFKMTDRNTTKLGSYSKSKKKAQSADRHESEIKREQIEQQKRIQDLESAQLQQSLLNLQKFKAPEPPSKKDPWAVASHPEDDVQWPLEKPSNLYDTQAGKGSASDWIKNLKTQNQESKGLDFLKPFLNNK